MNKDGFVKELAGRLNYSVEKAILINDIFEDNLLIGKKNKEKIVNDLIAKVGFNEDEANKIYETAFDIIKDAAKDKLKHPFKDLDKK